MPIVSGIGSIVGGILGAGASKKAGEVINNAGTGWAGSTQAAGKTASDNTTAATNIGVAGINSATGEGVQGINDATKRVGDATTAGQSGVSNAVDQSNTVAGNLLGGQLQNLSPYTQTGWTGTQALQNQVNNPFKAPTEAEAAASPGEQFQLHQGLQGLMQQIGATGGGATGGTLKALDQYGQGVASTYYQNAFNNAQNAYNTNTNTAALASGQGLQASSMANQAAQNYGNLFNSNTMGGAQFNAGLGMQGAGLGLTGATAAGGLGLSGATAAGGLGLGGATTAGNQLIGSTEAAGQFGMQGAQGKAAGIMGAANGINQAIGGFGNMFNPMSTFSNPSSWFGFGGGGGSNPFGIGSGNIGDTLPGYNVGGYNQPPPNVGYNPNYLTNGRPI